MVSRIKTVKKLSRKEELDQYFSRDSKFSILDVNVETFPTLNSKSSETVDKENNRNRDCHVSDSSNLINSLQILL